MNLKDMFYERDRLVEEKQKAIKKMVSAETKAGKANAELRDAQAKVAKFAKKLKAIRNEIGAVPASDKADYFAEIEAEKKKKTARKKEESKTEEVKEEETKEVEPIT